MQLGGPQGPLHHPRPSNLQLLIPQDSRYAHQSREPSQAVWVAARRDLSRHALRLSIAGSKPATPAESLTPAPRRASDKQSYPSFSIEAGLLQCRSTMIGYQPRAS